MERQDRDVLRVLRVYIIKNLTRLKEVLDYLESKRIISENQRDSILTGGTSSDCIRNLLDTLVRCGPEAFPRFKEALAETNQDTVLEALQSQPPISSPKIDVKLLEKPAISVKKYSRDLSPPTELLDSYTVKSLPRGYVLIINNENYAESTGYSKRLGSAQDVQKLCSLFQEFSYSVAVLQDPKGDEFMKAVRSFASKEELGKVDAAGLVILSHGLQHHVIASDGTLVNLDSVVSCFTTQNCPLLAGKPKLLIFQACRGEGRDYGASTTGSGRSSACGITAVDYSLGPASWVSLPYMCDAVIAFSTLPGFVSWRSEKEGSWYISKLVEVFYQLGRRVHVMDLLTQVNNKMVEESGSNKFQQMAQIVTTLRKLYFLSTVTE